MSGNQLYNGPLPIWIDAIQEDSHDVHLHDARGQLLATYRQPRTFTVKIADASDWMYKIGDVFPLPIPHRPQMRISSIESTHCIGCVQWTLSGHEC